MTAVRDEPRFVLQCGKMNAEVPGSPRLSIMTSLRR